MKKHIILLSIFICNYAFAQFNSVLSNGDWYKISTNQDGIYRLDYEDFESLGIELSNLSINSIKLYGNGNGMLSELNSDFRHTDLIENAIKIYDLNNNAIFDIDDFILFYGNSPTVWNYNSNTATFSHETNLYSDEVFFFLTINNDSDGKRITSKNSYLEHSHNISFFDAYQLHEIDNENLISSGRQWFGERFSSQQERIFNFNFPNLDYNSNVNVKAAFAARSLENSSFNIESNNTSVNLISIDKITNAYATEYAKTASSSSNFNINNDNIDLKIKYNSFDNGAIGWLNYIEVNSRRHLSLESDYLIFRDASKISNEVAKFELSNITSDVLIWDVTDSKNVMEIVTDVIADQISFKDSINIIHEYIAFNNKSYLTPNFYGSIQNQNLHNFESDIQYIIITHQKFLSSAERLAQFHINSSSLKSKVVTLQEVYNEFSSGSQDVTAIRDFVKMLYNRPNSQLKYLLLFGDGSYDPKDRITNNNNYIPTYQSSNSTHPIYSYVTDDFFGLLDEDEGIFTNFGNIDIGVGRLPVSSVNEADAVVNKIELYHNRESYGNWRNNIVFVADDGDANDGNTHMWQADSLANYISDNYDNINIQKIYLDNYYQESTSAGPRSPNAQYSINNTVDKGALLVNFTGHGSPLGWTKERILELDQISSWRNINKLPLFMTATCKFSYFDDPSSVSAGEELLLNPDGGAIGLLSTTRLVYSPPNYNLNSKFIRTIFNKPNNEYLRLGDIVKKTKNLSGSSTNNRNFILLGDPALRLAYPMHNINVTHINDTLKALEEIVIEGQIEQNGTLSSDFNGEVTSIIFDKEITRYTLGQESCTPMPYRDQNNVLYRGVASVLNGKFSFSFIVPKDIEYNFGLAKISFYAINNDLENIIDASGSIGTNDSIFIGGTADNIVYDYDGAEINLYMNSRNFNSGGITDRNPILLADISDMSGINTVGNGIGHDITAVLDGNTSEVYVLNDFYEAEKDNYKKGVIRFPFYNLDAGEHTLLLKVWDVFNNSSQKEIKFVVVDDSEFIVSDFSNFPNPFSNKTDIYFEINQINQNLDYVIEIYSLTGVLIKSISRSVQDNTSYRLGPILWDGKDKNGVKLSSGMYFIRLGVTLENGQFSSKSQQIILLPL